MGVKVYDTRNQCLFSFRLSQRVIREYVCVTHGVIYARVVQ